MRSMKRLAGNALLLTVLLWTPELCLAANAGSASLSTFVRDRIILNALAAFFGIAGAAVFYYAIRMIADAYNEKAFTDATNSFIYVFIGFSVIAISGAFAGAFYQPGGFFPNISTLTGTSIPSIATFIGTAAAGAFTLMIVIAGIGMITAQGDEAAFDKWRKVLIGNCIGVMIMMISNSIVTGISSTGGPGAITTELIGIGTFLLSIVGIGCTISLVVAGILLIISIDESLRDRAKRAIIGCLISLLIVIAAYSIIDTFV